MPSATTTERTWFWRRKLRDPLPNEGVVANVSTFGEPAFEQIRLAAFIRDDGDSNFCSQICSRSVEGDRRERITSESALNLLRQPGGRTLDLFHVFMKHLSYSRVKFEGHVIAVWERPVPIYDSSITIEIRFRKREVSVPLEMRI